MELRAKQQEALEFGLAAERWILADPPGAGKTAVLARWLAQSGSQRSLIIAPLQVHGHWQDELRDWDGPLAVTAAGSKAQRLRAYSYRPVSIVGFESMRQDIDHLIGLQFDTIVVDEAHRLKSRSAQQTKAALKLARRAQRIALATGTPVMNRAEELWSLLNLVAPKTYTSFWRWAREHFEIEINQYGFNPRPVMRVGAVKDGHVELVRAEAKAVLLQRDMAELLPDLPPVIETVLPVELSPAERKAYDTLMKKGWMQLGGEHDEVVIASNAVAKQTRARQITSDWGSIDPAMGLGTKAKAAIALIADLDPYPVVVLSQYRETAERIAEATGGVTYTGGKSQAERVRALEEFRSGATRVFAGTIGAVGEGLDGLQHTASHLILVDRDWTPARNDQTIGRLARQGQQSVVNVYHIAAEDTVDDVVARALADKRDVIEALDLAGV